MQTFNLTATQA